MAGLPTYTGASGSLALPDALIKSRDSLAYSTHAFWTQTTWKPARWQAKTPPIADGLPAGEQPQRIKHWQRNVVGYLLEFELMHALSFSATGGNTATITASDGQPLFHATRPAFNDFRQQLALVDSYSDLRGDRASEIVAQVLPQWSFWSSIVDLNTDRTPRTIELVGAALQFAMLCVMRTKHALACPRPIEYSGLIQPMIQTPAYAALPSGHATEAYMFATIMEALLGLVPGNPGDAQTQLQLYRQAHRIAENRVVAGLHFPVDSIAGKLLGQTLGRYFIHLCSAATNFTPSTFTGPGIGVAEPLADTGFATDAGTSQGSSRIIAANALLKEAWKSAQTEWR